MKEFKRNYLITALCGTCMLTPALMMAQEAADTTQTHFSMRQIISGKNDIYRLEG